MPRAKAPGRKGLYDYTCISPLRAAARLRRLGRGGGREEEKTLSAFPFSVPQFIRPNVGRGNSKKNVGL